MHYSVCTMHRFALCLIVFGVVILAPKLCGVLQESDNTYLERFREEEDSRPSLLTEKFDNVLQCGPDESCADRCGSPANESEPYRCFCDVQCRFYKDCCMDYDDLCSAFRSSETLGDDQYSDVQTNISSSSQEMSLGVFRPDFECIGVEEFVGGTVWMKSVCDPLWTDPHMIELCHDVHSGETLARLPVQGHDGFTYRNIYCAQCNYAIADVIYWIGMSVCYDPPPPDAATNMHSLAGYLKTSCRTLVDEPRLRGATEPRFCLQNVDWCDPKFAALVGGEFFELATLCWRKYQGLVRGTNASGDASIYKNPFCAMCNGIRKDDMSCDVPTLTRYTNVYSYYDYFFDVQMTSPKHISRNQSRPAYVVITNFNLRNSSNVFIFSADGTNALLPVELVCPDTEVYDPYIGECRQTYCAVGYRMNHNQCVRDTTEYFGNETIEMTFSVTVKIMWFVEEETGEPIEITQPINGTDYNFTDPRGNVTTRSFVIGRRNVTMALSEIVEFQGIWDKDSLNDTIDDVTLFWLSLLSFEVEAIQVNIAGNVFNIDPDNIENFFNSLKGNIGELANFLEMCPEGMVKNVYSTDQVLVTTDKPHGDCQNIQIMNTSLSYECNKWLFLEYSSHDHANESLTDEGVSYTSAVVCEDDASELDPTCVRIQYGASECTIENGTTAVCINGKQYGPGEYETTTDGRIFVCSDLDNVIETKSVVHFNFTKGQNIIAVCGVALSTTCLTVTLFTYAVFKELRTLPGMNLMTLAVILLVNDWTFLFGLYATDNKNVCRAIGIFLHFICLCQFFWGNVIAFDVYKTFGRKRLTKVNTNTPHRKQYLRYSLYAWGMPVIIVSISAILDFCECTALDVDYGMYFSCWISDPIAYSTFFGIPMFATNAANLVMFGVTVWNLRRHHHKSAVISGNANTHNHLALCAKLATVMGFAWNLAFFASVLHNSVLWYFFFVLYFLQGFFMFLSYTINRRVYRMYMKKFGRERLPSAQTLPPPNARSQLPSVTSQGAAASPLPREPPILANISRDLHLPGHSSYQYLPDDDTLPSIRSSICRQFRRPKSHSCSVAHISSTDNFDPIPGPIARQHSLGHHPRRASRSDDNRRPRTKTLGDRSFEMTTLASDAPHFTTMTIEHLDMGTYINEAFHYSDQSSSDDDDIFLPAYHFTEC